MSIPSALAETLARLDYCLRETQAATGAVKEAALAAMREGEPVAAEQFAAMCEAEAGLINLRGRASRCFRASCPVPAGSQEADDTH